MPEVSRFYGIVVRMFYGDHPPPHFHAVYGGDSAKIDIETLSVIDGRLPVRALRLVVERASMHQNELRAAFENAENLVPPGQIDPLP